VRLSASARQEGRRRDKAAGAKRGKDSGRRKPTARRDPRAELLARERPARSNGWEKEGPGKAIKPLTWAGAVERATGIEPAQSVWKIDSGVRRCPVFAGHRRSFVTGRARLRPVADPATGMLMARTILLSILRRRHRVPSRAGADSVSVDLGPEPIPSTEAAEAEPSACRRKLEAPDRDRSGAFAASLQSDLYWSVVHRSTSRRTGALPRSPHGSHRTAR
jgi:hypothetical protein